MLDFSINASATYQGIAVVAPHLLASMLYIAVYTFQNDFAFFKNDRSRKVRQRETSKYHIQLCIALLLMLVMALVLVATSAQKVDLLYGGCVFISVFVHYFALVAVMWMGAEALLMLQKVVIIFVRITTKYIVILSLICWCKLITIRQYNNNYVSYEINYESLNSMYTYSGTNSTSCHITSC